MSDTPRTDHAWKTIHTMYELVGEMKSIERELNAANERIKRLDEFVEQLTNPKFTRDDLPSKELIQRIKRLEEAGDKLASHHLIAVTTYDKAKSHVAAWYKAKEAKP